MNELMFFIFAFGCVYSYFIYPIILKLMPTRKILNFDTDKDLPSLTLIITAHNEESRIQEKLENTLTIDYPDEKLEILIASDFSTDKTDIIVESYADKGIKLVRADQRKGKEYAQLCAIRVAKNEILVFSDVATTIEKGAFLKLAERFHDPAIGAISSEDQFLSQDGKVVGEGAYVKYEMWLRRLESNRAGLIGLSGSFFSARAKICKEWDIASPSDFNTALNCAKSGLISISSPDVIGIYQDVKDPSLEYRRKTRTIIRGITAISRHLEVLNPFIFGMFSFQVWSHKIMRWLVPWFLFGTAFFSLTIMNIHWFYLLAVILQVLFYILVLIGQFIKSARELSIIKIPYFFMQVNTAILHASLQFIFGKRVTVWQPSKR